MQFNKQDDLKSLGERQIIDNIIMKIFPNIVQQNDDCATIQLDCGTLQLSTDPSPEPIAFCLGYVDYYHYGWLTAVVNLSDLAAMGATPVGLLVSTVMNENMKISDYERFLTGLKDACDHWKCPLIGGNVKDGEKFTANGFILGRSESNVLAQYSAKEGDVICVLGDMGMFWASVIYEVNKEKIIVSEEDKTRLFNALTRPKAKIFEAIEIAKTGLVSACTDNSDGMTWHLTDLARKSKVDFIIDSNELLFDGLVNKIAGETNCDIINLMLSGGDYQLICTVSPNNVQKIEEITSRYGTKLHKIGYVRKGDGKAFIKQNNKIYNINDISSERFNANSLFTHGYKSYIHVLQNMNAIGTEDL